MSEGSTHNEQRASASRQVSLAEALQIALAYHRQGGVQSAEELYTSILRVDPSHLDAMHLLGVIRCQQGRLDEAEQLLRGVIERQPESTAFQNSWGRLLLLRGRREDALSALRRALELSPQNPEAFFNLAEAELSALQLPEAIQNYEKCLLLHPSHPTARFGLAQAVRLKDGWSAAIPQYQLAAANAPENPVVHHFLATALMLSGHTEAAMEVLERLTSKWPEFADGWSASGAVNFALGRLPQSISAYEKAIALKPDAMQALDGLVEARRRACDWRDDIAILEQRLVDYVQRCIDERQQPVVRAFTSLYIPCNGLQQLAIARANSASLIPLDKNNRYTEKAFQEGRLRIGYMIADVRNHPNAHNTLMLYGLHDRERFEVFVYSWGVDDSSVYRHRIRGAAEHFVEMRGWSEESIAGQIASDGIQILVDLMGHTSDNRLGVLARRPAPVQINYLGYPGTTGADFVDYIIGDKWVTPESHAEAFSEVVLRLPNSYQINSVREVDLRGSPDRASLGLPTEGFVYCCFNTAYKFTPRVFSLWMNILKAVPNSVFWTYASGSLVDRHLKETAQQHGIDPSRIILGPQLPREEHLQRMQVADLFLDTEYYNAHTTATDALWAGVPILTVPGETFSARVCASLLDSAGLADCILGDWESYQDTAIAVARDPSRLYRWREHLRAHRESLPVFDTASLVRDLEALYLEVWQKKQAQQQEGGLP